MTKFLFLKVALVCGALVMSASLANAQQVGMAGQYHESNGIIVNIPQNPPIIPCDPMVDDARCHKRVLRLFLPGGPVVNTIYEKPTVGNQAARLIPTVGGATAPNPPGLNVGDPFQVPDQAFFQRKGKQVGIVLNSSTKQLDTTFTAVAPFGVRGKNPAPLSNRFSAGNWNAAGNGQNNGLTGPNFEGRLAAATVVTDNTGAESVAVRYIPGSNEFGGTMAVLLDGGGTLWLQSQGLSAALLQGTAAIPFFAPIVVSQPLGQAPGFAERNAVGWKYTRLGGQNPGPIKYFGPGAMGTNPPPVSPVISPECDPTPPPTPAGCNQVNVPVWQNSGMFLGNLPAATSTKFMFAWTTGTVSLVRTAIRNMITQTDTLTAMGYDTTGTSNGAPSRNVGLVAGSYTIRSSNDVRLNIQMIGMDLKFTPEPGATVALISGLGLLGALAIRRRR